ncbi:MAG: NADH-quinone oxidoreductase subunit B family protein [Acidiferrobacter sp.]
MPLWTWQGLRAGSATTSWPDAGDDGQDGVYGLPRLDHRRCAPDCARCQDACPTSALFAEKGATRLDYGRCIGCQLCTEVCPTGALQPSTDWAFGVRDRVDLVWREALASTAAKAVQAEIARCLRKSFHIRHVDAGSCNGCESELSALNNPFYNLHRLGVFFTPSPRFADLLLVTGPVTRPMREPLLRTWEAMPTPRYVMASGTCAVSGAPMDSGYARGQGLADVLPVDIWLPGCPPNPAALIHALLLLLGRRSGHVQGGHYEP